MLVDVDDVLPPDPVDSRRRVPYRVLYLDVPDADAFAMRLAVPSRHTVRPVVHVLEALYGVLDTEPRAVSSAFRFIPKTISHAVVAHNDLELNRKGVLRCPAPHRPLFEMPPNFLWPMRGVDWAALNIQVLDDGVTDWTDRILAVAAHNGVVLRGHEHRIRSGMLQITKSAKLAAWLPAHRLPCPQLPDADLGSKKWVDAVRPPKRAAKAPYDVEATLASPHYWWAVEHMRTAWDYVPPNTPIDSPVFAFGQYDLQHDDGTEWAPAAAPRIPKLDLLTYLEATARADVAATPRPRGLTDAAWLLARWGLVCFRLPDDRALPERAGYCSYITPRGWRTLWADGRMLEWHDVVARMTAPSG